MQEKEWNEKFKTSKSDSKAIYKTYMGGPLERDIIISLKLGAPIIGEFNSVTINHIDGDSLNVYCSDGWKSINMNKVKAIDLYIDEEDVKTDNLRLFNPSDIKPLNYKDLDGKTLKMTVVDNDECLLVAGIDKENNKIYMLHSEVK